MQKSVGDGKFIHQNECKDMTSPRCHDMSISRNKWQVEQNKTMMDKERNVWQTKDNNEETSITCEKTNSNDTAKVRTWLHWTGDCQSLWPYNHSNISQTINREIQANSCKGDRQPTLATTIKEWMWRINKNAKLSSMLIMDWQLKQVQQCNWLPSCSGHTPYQ